jgi:polyferredoxin
MSKPTFHFPRRTVQIASLLVIALIPAAGLFRIDLASASFNILDRQIWWSNFAFISGMTIVLITVTILSYVTIGTVWCGWACPQNLLVEWANNLTYKFLGKRADVRVDGKGMVVAKSKNKAINWLILGGIFLAASLILALIPVLYFLPPGDVWDFITFSANQNVTSFITFPYFFIALLIFIDIAFIRYFFCDYACFYRVGQMIFKARNALHVSYDASRSADCAKCTYCATSCITNIQPTNIKAQDRCIGCGVCIDACDKLHQKTRPHEKTQAHEKTWTTGLLRFEIGNGGHATWKQKLKALSTRFNWIMGAASILGLAMMTWGVVMQPAPLPQKSPAALQNIQHITQMCNSQCAAFITSCKKHIMQDCYRASACKCACNLQQDPANTESEAWRQCVRRFTTLAETFGLLNTDSMPK